MQKNVSKTNNKKKTKKDNLINIDNEIIIGIKPLLKPEISKQKSSKKKANKNKKMQVQKTQKQNKNKKKVINKKENKQFLEIKKCRHIFKLVKWTTLFVILITTTIYFMLSPFFNIKTINVSGNEKISTDEVISLSNIKLEENTFKISKTKVENLIKENSYIDDVKIERNLPDKIEIQIIERKPTYMISFANAYILINNQGYLLEISKELLEVPIITGFLTPEDKFHVGNRLCEEDLQSLNNVLQIMNSANSSDIGKLVDKINVSNKQDYVLELKSKKKEIHIGDTSNLSTKMLFIEIILQDTEEKEGEIFVNMDLNTKKPIFREKV